MRMELRFAAIALVLTLFPLMAQAAFRPVATLSAGTDVVTTHMNQTITLVAPFQNTYISTNTKADFVGGLFLGVETPLFQCLSGQLGLSYYQNDAYQAQGTVYQFSDPSMGNLTYQYNIQSQRVLLESKLLGTLQDKYHPYVNIGIGETINTANKYVETPIISAAEPMSSGFREKTKHALAYLVGVGIDMDVSSHIRLGGGYRYVNLGRAQLTTTATQQSTGVLKNDPLFANEVLLQLTYVG